MPAPTQQSLTLANAILKDYYGPALARQLNDELPLFNRIRRRTRGWTGRRYVFPVHLERSQAVRAAAEGGALPSAQAQGYVEAVVERKTILARGRITGEAIEQARTSRGAFRDLLLEEMTRLKTDIVVEAGRQIWGRGDGVLAQINGAVNNAATVTVDNPGTRFLHRHMKLDVWSSRAAGAAREANNLVIDSIANGTQFELSAPATLSDNYFITRADVRDANNFHELTGVEAMVDDGGLAASYQGVSRAANPAWKAYVNGNGGNNRALTIELMLKAVNAIENSSGEQPNLIVCHSSVWEKYAELLHQNRRFSSAALQGGVGRLTFSGGGRDIEVVKDRFAPYNRMFLLNTDHIHLFQVNDFTFMDRDGSQLARVGDSFAYEFTVYFMGNLGTTRCNAHGRIDDITAAA
ncbi:MAG: hypothetical protein GMKNLPBB_00823 [Myxococcota bacterium]|nr:hypothetical protein [Myxococcota bacterium]